MISDFSEAATFIFQKLPQFGTFLEIAKILTKTLPQFGVSVFVMRSQKFCQKFCPSLDVRSSLKMFGSVVLPL